MASPRPRRLPIRTAPDHDPRRRVILIVDDDEDVRETFADALRFEGYTVQAVCNGEEALARLRAEPGARWLVVLDLMMPVMDGEVFLAHRSRDPVLSRIAVILVTAGGDCRELRAKHEVAGCLPKTAPLSVLVAAIEACA